MLRAAVLLLSLEVFQMCLDKAESSLVRPYAYPTWSRRLHLRSLPTTMILRSSGRGNADVDK